MVFKIVCVLISSVAVLGAKFPDEIEKCDFEDHSCLIERMNWILQNKYEGVPGIRLAELDPLDIPSMSISQGGNSPVNIDIQFKNVKFSGLKNAVVTNITGFKDVDQQNIGITFKAPSVSLCGPYTIKGKILVLPIEGKGDSNITVVNATITMRFKGALVTKNNKEYLQLSNAKVAFTTTRMYIYYGNLFNGDEILGPTTNQFLNENWQIVLQELYPSIAEGFAQVYQGTLNNVFASHPYRSFFQGNR
ncbi:hypothetical protein DMENIID0001_064750 [Sergentomyia squamirostris]